MKLVDIIDWVMMQSGEFIVEIIENTLIDKPKFWLMVKRDLKFYQKYVPVTKNLNVYVNGSYGFPAGEEPKFISKCTPVVAGSTGSSGFSTLSTGQLLSMANPMLGMSPTRFIWKYEEPQLFTSMAGDVAVKAHYDYKFDVSSADPAEYEILGMREEDLFLNLVLSSFLIGLGRSRRAFTLNDLPITMDAPDLVSEGKERQETARQDIFDLSKWYNGIPT
jgi:hypothetical protein